MPECDWKRIGKRLVCENCDRTITYRGRFPRAVCRVICEHLGAAVERDGVAIMVACRCTGETKERKHASRVCEIHGRCLPTLRPVGEQRAEWLARKPESDLYHLCDGCEDFTTSD